MSRSSTHQFPANQVAQDTQIGRDKVVAAPWQVTALQQLRRRAGDSPPKEEIVRVGKETGLEVRWIRNWLSRQRRGRGKSGREGSTDSRQGDPSSSSTGAPPASKPNTAGSSPRSDVSIHQVLQDQQGGKHPKKRKRQPDTTSRSPEAALEPAAPEVSVHIATPGSSFSLPLYQDHQLQSSGSNPFAPVESSQGLNSLKTRTLVQSPSLGYIPLAFPMVLSHLSGADTFDKSSSGDTSFGSSNASSVDAPAGSQFLAGSQASYPTLYSERFAPTVPTLPTDYTQVDLTEAESQRTLNMLYLSQLLLDATNAHVPHPATTTANDSAYLSGLAPLSFAPSMQSHSTSVLGTASMSLVGQRAGYLWYPPPPVAFKARVTDLALLTKRIRATHDESADERSVDGMNGDDREKSASNASRMSSTAAVAAEDDDSDVDDEEIQTPTDDLPAFIGDFDQSRKAAKTTGKGKQVVYEDGVLTTNAD